MGGIPPLDLSSVLDGMELPAAVLVIRICCLRICFEFRLALPVPRPGRDREARRHINIMPSRHDSGFGGHTPSSYKPGLPWRNVVTFLYMGY